jgi:hypothetical protein
MTDTSRFISFAVAAVDIPDQGDRALIGSSNLVALAMLIAERDADHRWRFALEHRAIAAGENENLLLSWASQAMPESGIVLGWQLRDQIVQPLLEVSSDSDPEMARGFLGKLRKLLTAPSIDLAVHHGGVGAKPFADVVGTHGVATSPMNTGDIESAWAFGERQRLRDHVATQAIATWRLWLAELNGGGEAAKAAFAAWLG